MNNNELKDVLNSKLEVAKKAGNNGHKLSNILDSMMNQTDSSAEFAGDVVNTEFVNDFSLFLGFELKDLFDISVDKKSQDDWVEYDVITETVKPLSVDILSDYVDYVTTEATA